MKLHSLQRGWAKQVYSQINDHGVALLQLPTGQGKTLVALKVIAHILAHSKASRPVVLVTKKQQDREMFASALRGEAVVDADKQEPWIRIACKAGGLARLCPGAMRKLGSVDCRSAHMLHGPLPSRAIVIVDEVHRFRTFLERVGQHAYQAPKGPPCSAANRRRFLLLSATPINPTGITEAEEQGSIGLDEEREREDERVKTGYLNLYRAMIGLSWLKPLARSHLCSKLDRGRETSLEQFASILREVMKVLKPIPGPEVLETLGPKGPPSYSPRIRLLKPRDYRKSVQGLWRLHASFSDELNPHYYCAERMALAGVKAKKTTVGFPPLPKTFAARQLSHIQPNAPYATVTLDTLRRLERNKGRIRRLLAGKVAALYQFLRTAWKDRRGMENKKWRILIYCAHRGSVAAVAAELEKRFLHDDIVCSCSAPESRMYGPRGARRVVWDTEGYSARRDVKHPEKELRTAFCRGRSSDSEGASKYHCPCGFVLVTSDRLSESIGLHSCCDVLVHFDLDWSPLRMIQRYGRLWRIENPAKAPKPPAVFHLVQPGSVDEEILWRLETRWDRLSKLGLGLDLIDLNRALGARIYGRVDA